MIKYMTRFFFILLLVGCFNRFDDYNTFDYKSMKVSKSKIVSDKSAWIEPIIIDDEKVIINVQLRGKKTKRLFEKKDEFWYSELNYRYNPVKGTGQELYEVYQKIYIYQNYIIKESKDSNGLNYIIYLDLLKKEIYYFKNWTKDNFNLDTALLGDYYKYIYILKDSELHKKQFNITKGITKDEYTEVVYGYSGDDIFFIFDLDEYKIGDNSSGYMELFNIN